MRYILILLACSFLFLQCRRADVTVYPTGSYDTLGIHWMTIDRTNITYYFQGTGLKAASIYTDMHEEAYVRVNNVFNAKLPRKLRFFVWTDWQAALTLYNEPAWVGGFAQSKQCVCHQRADMSLGHEMTHVLSYWGDGIPMKTYSRFINEGIAETFDLSETDKIGAAKKVLQGKGYHDVMEIWRDDENMPEDILYPVSGAFVQFLYKKNQPDKFFALVKNQTIEDAENIYGKAQLEALMAEFNGLVGL